LVQLKTKFGYYKAKPQSSKGQLSMKSTLCVSIMFAVVNVLSWAQSPNATVAGRVLDPSSAVVSDAKVDIINLYTNIHYTGQTNHEGSFVIPNLPPGPYRIEVSKSGFKTAVREDVVLRVQDVVALNFTLPIGSVKESVTVTGGAPLVNTQDAAVSTVVDRNFADNLPLNGRSFQTLIYLTPGVVITPTTSHDSGQFSVNGQRASSNYWMVDGVGANIGVGGFQPGNGFAGAVGSTSAQGGTNSLVSVDAMQEFRILTSTYAPEFGRTPGGQISIVTRSGTNQFHGTAFDYLRNDIFDANDWFADSKGLPKPEERQNDFGGTVSGPIIKDRMFFFFSYEGLRLRLPQVALTTVPDTNPADPLSRQFAIVAMQPFLNAYPQPNGPEILDSNGSHQGLAQFNSSFSDKSSLDAYSLRLDHRLGSNLTIFGRYNYSPSSLVLRAEVGGNDALSVLHQIRTTTQTGTVGTTWSISPAITNDLRFNYSSTTSSGDYHLDGFGGAVPLTSPPFPAPFTTRNSSFFFDISQPSSRIAVGNNSQTLQRQINLVDNLSVQNGLHSLKFGFDFRRLSPEYNPDVYQQDISFSSVSDAQSGTNASGTIASARRATILFRNLGVFAQDTWRMAPRLTVTYGLRWDVDFAPSSVKGPSIAAVTGYNLNDLSQLALAPAGTQPFRTTYGNVAPRLGVAYQVSQNQNWQTVLRGGFGVYFDLATSEAGNGFLGSYPFGAFVFPSGVNFPLDATTAAPPAITAATLASGDTLFAFDPHLNLPYTLQWNVALEQGLGKQQAISASYIGASGRRLIQTASVFAPNANIGFADLVTNAGTSDYDALQVQFQRRLSRGLQALASYSWSHSIDTGSAGSWANSSNTAVPSALNANRGPSDFDNRNAFSAGATYDIPARNTNVVVKSILRGWSVQNVIQARSAPPVNVWNFFSGFGEFRSAVTQVRPDLVSGIPLYLYGAQYPGGKAFNNTPGAVVGGCSDGSQSVGPFCPPPIDSNGKPLRQGNLGRNALRGFGATQWDFAVHRDFPIHESLKLQFRAEMFNVLNHPNFSQPLGEISGIFGPFGRATQMLARGLDQNPGGGSFSALYQIGGPRSMQFALKLLF
jgi:carboxypeptidase family protein/TonB-dependent receptor-like protein